MAGLPTIELALTDELAFILELGVAVALALVAGAIAVRLRQPPIVGYLVAGVVIGPFTPGFVGDTERISELAEVGVDAAAVRAGRRVLAAGLDRVRAIVVPGAIAQILLVTLAGARWSPAVLGTRRPGRDRGRRRRSRSARRSSCSSSCSSGARPTASTAASAIGWMIVQDIARDPDDGDPAAARRRRPARAARARARQGGAVPARWRTSSARGSCRGCSGRSAASARRSCSCSRCSRRPSSRRSCRAPCSASRSRSARSSPG